MDAVPEKPRLRSLLEPFSTIPDARQSWRVAHPLPEVLLLVVCGTIAGHDDDEDITDWGQAHLAFLRGFSAFHFGIPCADWLRDGWPAVPDLIALDGKTARRSHDRKAGRKALHLVSAFATTKRLVLGQEACEEKSNEVMAIPALLAQRAACGSLKGALVTIDAIACNPDIAQAILDGEADSLLAVKDNQPTLQGEVADFFATARPDEIEAVAEVDKDHGRIETRRCTVSHKVDWMTSN